MDDIRRLERETQLILQKKLGRVSEDTQLEEEGEEERDGGEREVKEGGPVVENHVEDNSTSEPHSTPTASGSTDHRQHSIPSSSSSSPPLPLTQVSQCVVTGSRVGPE